MTINLADHIANLAQPETPVEAPKSSGIQRGGVKARSNLYGGKCVKCSAWVEPKGGTIVKIDGRWLVEHVECPETDDRPVEPRPQASEPVAPAKPVKHGIYTVVIDGEHATFRISHQADDARFAPGKDVIGVMEGTDNHIYTSVGFVNSGRVVLFRKNQGADRWWVPFLDKLTADPEASLDALNCRKCNRLLTEPDSIAKGIGPYCEGRS